MRCDTGFANSVALGGSEIELAWTYALQWVPHFASIYSLVQGSKEKLYRTEHPSG
jgi:hypothetical protein